MKLINKTHFLFDIFFKQLINKQFGIYLISKYKNISKNISTGKFEFIFFFSQVFQKKKRKMDEDMKEIILTEEILTEKIGDSLIDEKTLTKRMENLENKVQVDKKWIKCFIFSIILIILTIIIITIFIALIISFGFGNIDNNMEFLQTQINELFQIITK